MTGIIPLTLVYTALNATGLFLLRATMRGTAQTGIERALLEPRTLVGVFFYGCSFVTFILSLRYHPLTLIFPVFSGCAYAAVTLGGIAFLGEAMDLRRVAGIVSVAFGVALLQSR